MFIPRLGCGIRRRQAYFRAIHSPKASSKSATADFDIASPILGSIGTLFASRNYSFSQKECHMPEKETVERAKRDKAEGKAPTTQAGEFIREEMHHIREGKHGARSTKQAIAIGLSKARRAGVKLPPPERGKVSEKTRRSAERAYEIG